MAESPIRFKAERVLANTPAVLRALPQWVCWAHVERQGTLTKEPVNARNGRPASVTNPKHWATFDLAMKRCAATDKVAGLGFVFSTDDPYCGVDLDDACDAQHELKPWALDIVTRLNSYTELSPSGLGVKVFLEASKPGPKCRRGWHDGEVEIYDSKRFFTVTGASLITVSCDVNARQAELLALYDELFGGDNVDARRRHRGASSGVSLSDDEIIKKASESKSGDKFQALMQGRWQDSFGSQSEADLSLVSRLAFYTKNPSQLDRIFRRSGLYREKWDERHGEHTYGEMTIGKALDTVTEQYDAARNGRRSRDRSRDADEPEPGTIDQETGRLMLCKARTLPTAKAFVDAFYRRPDGITLRHYGGLLMEWRENRYVEIEDAKIRHQLFPWLHDALLVGSDDEFPANPRHVNEALDSIKSHVYLPVAMTPPVWIGDVATPYLPMDIIPCKNMLLHLPTLTHVQPTPLLFNISALAYDHDPSAPPAQLWDNFLRQVFKDDFEASDLLQEWFGYCLTGDTSLQKMLLIVGPRRCGKGTIGRVLSHLVGPGNVCGPATSSFEGEFGLQQLIGKSVAIVSDARFTGKNIQTVIERLLCISGEDTMTVNRKFLSPVTMRLPTRFMFLTNELPRLSDASGALAGRFMLLQLTESFYGREDANLSERLYGEAPAILNWAIEGLQRLRQRGRFQQPSSVAEVIRDLEDLSSPVSVFVRERCRVGAGLRVPVDGLYSRWREWCTENGRGRPSNKQRFGRDLNAAVPGLARRQGTEGSFYEGIALQ